jgi:arylsulfatase
LLTGLNPHAAGFGFPAQIDPGFPGYAMEFGPDVVTVAEIFGGQGYSTMMVGKWHLAREADGGPGGDRRSWPLQRGFDRFYGFIDGFTDYFAPHQLIEDNHAVCVETYPKDYYLTDDLTDKAITLLREQQVAYPGRPFFLYVAHGAVHAPLQAKPADVARHCDRYAIGWDEIRRLRFERQLELGLVPPGIQLPVRNWEAGNDVPDILPTLLELAGLERPTERQGVPVQPPAGASFAPTLVDSAVMTQHREQH